MAKLTQAQLARVVGVSRQQINKLAVKGVIKLDADGKIDEDDAKAAILAASNPAHASTRSTVAARLQSPDAPAMDPPPAAPAEPPPPIDINNFQVARTLREKYAALIAKVEYEEAIGQLVRKDLIDRQAFELARQTQQTLIGIPDRIALILAAESDPHRVHTLLTNEIHRAMADIIKAAPGVEMAHG
jgi:hypothetical protein